MKVPFSYLDKQFKNPTKILAEIKKLVKSGDFTLGQPVSDFENSFAKLCQTKYAVGVGTGTDALRLSLIALGIGPGDEVITVPNTFYATVGAIATTGAKPVFVDVRGDYVINTDLIEDAITEKTKAILPVHLYGCPSDMPAVIKIAKKHNLPVVEDACQAISAEIDGKRVGSFGIAGGFSVHPLKGINVWGDGGVISTSDSALYDKLTKLRNHGLKNRDECEFYGYNCRLDTLQAIVGNSIIKDAHWITEQRIKNAKFYDEELSETSSITLPPRKKNIKEVYHTYVIRAKNRDALLSHLQKNGVEAKVHYPIPLHLQEASRYLGYKKGDFPETEAQASSIITLPAHQHLKQSHLEYVVKKIKEFYK